MNLEKQLSAAAEPWLAAESIDADRAAALETLVRARSRRRPLRWIGTGVAAAAVAGMAFFSPVVVALASGAPVVGPYIARMAKYDQGAYWADQKGYVVPVNKQAVDNGYTFRVESIMADPARTVVYWTLEGPDLDGTLPAIAVDMNMKDYHKISGRSELVDGRLIGELHAPPLPTPTTAMKLGIRRIGSQMGDWKVSFMASRAGLTELAREVTANQPLKGEGYDLKVTKVLLAPTQTVVEMEGTVDADAEVRGMELWTDGAQIGSHSANISSTRAAGSKVADHSFRIAFDRVDLESYKEITFRLTDVVRWQSGGPVLELQPGKSYEDNYLRMEFLSVGVENGETLVSVRIPPEKAGLFKDLAYRDWILADADGKVYEYLSVGPAEDPGVMQFRFHGTVDNPVRLEAREHAEPLAGAEVSIPLK